MLVGLVFVYLYVDDVEASHSFGHFEYGKYPFICDMLVLVSFATKFTIIQILRTLCDKLVFILSS